MTSTRPLRDPKRHATLLMRYHEFSCVIRAKKTQKNLFINNEMIIFNKIKK